MPTVYPFRAVQYARVQPAPGGAPGDVSALVAPPYDVLDAEGKAALLRLSDHNIVAVDLPHIPAKELGPPGVYEAAAARYRAWLADGTLVRRPPGSEAMFAYRETFEYGGRRHQRAGMVCTLDVRPFGPAPGGGILPHEETFSGPKEDRMALMRATRAQLSPIFGLHQDERGEATALLQRVMKARGPDALARTEAGFGGPVLHEVWTVGDAGTISMYRAALSGEDVFIADGHHRYTTALGYLNALQAGGGVGPDHPARRCMFVLVGMSDPGLVIGPTHRVLGGMRGWSWSAFERAAAGRFDLVPCGHDLRAIEPAIDAAARSAGRPALGLYDFASRACWVATAVEADPLAARFPDKPRAWRTLDVALVQYLLVEQIAQPALNGGEPVRWAFPHSIDEVLDIGAGKEKGSGGGQSFTPQLAVIVRPTPLEAVREVSRANVLMPQKSTFFYPKLATGLFIHPLE